MALLRTPGIGGQTTLRLSLPRPQVTALDRKLSALLCPSLRRPLNPKEQSMKRQLLNHNLISAENLEWAHRQIQNHNEIEAKIYSFYDGEYPALLRLIDNPPPLIYVLGDLAPLTAATMTIVGARRPSVMGIQRAKGSLSLIMKASGVGVVSGLAVGIDAIAHQKTIDHGRYTAAVVGHGLSGCYPPHHQSLLKAILATGGAIISESPFDSPPRPSALVARDRIQSALTAVTYVVDSSPKGGSLHAARSALKQGRALWIPRSLKVILPEFKSEAVSWLTSTERLRDNLDRIAHSHDTLMNRAQWLAQALDEACNQENNSDPPLSLF